MGIDASTEALRIAKCQLFSRNPVSKKAMEPLENSVDNCTGAAHD